VGLAMSTEDLQDHDPVLKPSTLFALASNKDPRPDGNDASPGQAQDKDAWISRSNDLLLANCASRPKDKSAAYARGAFSDVAGDLQSAYATARAANPAPSTATSRAAVLHAVCSSDRFPEFCKYVNHINGYLLSKARTLPKSTVAPPDESDFAHFDDADDPSPAAEDEAVYKAACMARRAARLAARDPPDLVRNPFTQEAVHASVLAYHPGYKAYMWPPKRWPVEQPPPYCLNPQYVMSKTEQARHDFYQKLEIWREAGCPRNNHMKSNPPRDSKWAGRPGREIAEDSPNNFLTSTSQRYHQVTVESMRYQGLTWTKRTRPFPYNQAYSARNA
jgi:hypothetical protein